MLKNAWIGWTVYRFEIGVLILWTNRCWLHKQKPYLHVSSFWWNIFNMNSSHNTVNEKHQPLKTTSNYPVCCFVMFLKLHCVDFQMPYLRGFMFKTNLQNAASYILSNRLCVCVWFFLF